MTAPRNASTLLPCTVWMIVAAACPAQANPSLSTAGYGMTVGPVYNRANLGSASYNPANALRLVAPDERVRMGVAEVGAQYELGRVDDVQKTADDIKAAIEAANTTNYRAQLDLINNTYLPALGNGARFSVQADASLLAPLLVRSETLGGVVSLNVNTQAQIAGFFRGTSAEVVSTLTGRITTASAFDVKAAQVTQFSLGYSTDLTRHVAAALNTAQGGGQLDLGLRVNAYQSRLYRQLVAFVDNNGNSNSLRFNRDTSYRSKASAAAVDLGLMWGDENYQLGATIYNIGRPRLAYPDPSRDSNLANAQAAVKLGAQGKIVTDDAVSLKPNLVLEGSVFSRNRRWLAQGSLATSETSNFVGEAQRYATASVSYNAERFESDYGTLLNYLLPSARLGYRANLAGAKLATTGVGLSWGVLNLDVNFTRQRITANGSRAPRSAGVSLSMAEKF